MGIPFYFGRICRKYDMLVDADRLPRVDVLYFDYNSLVHPCVARALPSAVGAPDLEAALIDSVIAYTEEVIALVRPRRRVVLAIDGVAPRAKMNQQRERRYKKVLAGDETGPAPFDTNLITPGTSFMDELGRRLRQHAFSVDTLVSGADECGEGEHKIMKMIAESRLSPDASDDSRRCHCIYGMDADLIMLSLLCGGSRCDERILLLRDDTVKGSRVYLDVASLRDGIVRQQRGARDGPVEDLVADYVVLCFLFGNDFLPAVPGLGILSGGRWSRLARGRVRCRAIVTASCTRAR